MHLVAEAHLLAIRPHGENGAIVRALTEAAGLQPGFVSGGRSRALRPVLQPGNTVLGRWRARTDEQLPQLAVELIHSRAPLFNEALPAVAIGWLTGLAASVLPEGQPYPRVYHGLGGVLDAIEAAPTARGWAAALARFELLVLAELGFGLDLERCVVSGGRNDLAFVSPRSGGAVARSAAGDYESRLFPLPAFLAAGGPADWPDIFDALRITGHFLARDLLIDRRAPVLDARERLVDRLHSAVA